MMAPHKHQEEPGDKIKNKTKKLLGWTEQHLTLHIPQIWACVGGSGTQSEPEVRGAPGSGASFRTRNHIGQKLRRHSN